MQRGERTISRAACLVLLLAGGCGGDASDASTQADPSPPSPSTVTTAVVPAPLPTTTLTTTVAPTPELRLVAQSFPEQGTAVVREGDVVLLDFEGGVVGRVVNATIDFAMEPGGPLLVRSGPSGENAFRLDIRNRELVRVSRQATDLNRFAEVPKPPITPGYGQPPPGQDVIGHWRWVGSSPRGGTRLGTWSSECEVPHAFFIDPDGTVRSVLGGDWILEPNSAALGWAPDGRALVWVAGEAACGTASPTPGLYLIDPSSGSMTKFTDDQSGLVWGPGTA